MSRIGIVAAISVLIAVSAAGAAVAQQRTSPTYGPSGQQPPAGTYQQSCRAITLTGTILRAQCNARSGPPLSATLDIRGCRGDIGNDNGALRCNGGGGPQPPRPPVLPAGSYQQTCRGITLNGNILRAQCPTRSGAPISSSLDVNSCRGRDIGNDNGYLRCNAGGGPQPPRPPVLPAGSYQQTCRGITLNGNILRAQCPTRSGAPISSSLDVNSCRGRDIGNDNGYLRCNAGGPQPPTPPRPVPPTPGGFQAIGYTGANFTGRQLIISGPISDLAARQGFNDNLRSIRIVRGRGEVCVDRLYRGRCVRIDQSYRDLNAIDMGNRISSIR